MFMSFYIRLYMAGKGRSELKRLRKRRRYMNLLILRVQKKWRRFEK